MGCLATEKCNCEKKRIVSVLLCVCVMMMNDDDDDDDDYYYYLYHYHYDQYMIASHSGSYNSINSISLLPKFSCKR